MASPFVLLALLQLADVTPPKAPRVSSADDCAIMVLAGKEKLGWGNERPRMPFSANTTWPDGSPAYVVNCKWEDYGIVPPERQELTPERPQPMTSNASITSPVYSPNGLQAAAAVVITEIAGGRFAMEQWSCNFFRENDRWNLSGCKQL